MARDDSAQDLSLCRQSVTDPPHSRKATQRRFRRGAVSARDGVSVIGISDS